MTICGNCSVSTCRCRCNEAWFAGSVWCHRECDYYSLLNNAAKVGSTLGDFSTEAVWCFRFALSCRRCDALHLRESCSFTLASVGGCLLFRASFLPCQLAELRLHFVGEMIKGRRACSCNSISNRGSCPSCMPKTHSPDRFAARSAAVR